VVDSAQLSGDFVISLCWSTVIALLPD